MSSENQDLPLHSLNSGYKVNHYILKLTCILEKRTFDGEVYAFVQSSKPGSNLILDLKDLHIMEVVEIDANKQDILLFLESFEERKKLQSFEFWMAKNVKQVLKHSTDDWCVKVENLQTTEALVCFRYQTKPEGSSVSWFQDDDNNPCCLTTGCLINNRSLLPSQDAPSLMATWQLMLQIPNGLRAATTGDDEGIFTENGIYFYTSMLLPISTFALAIGSWKCSHIPLRFESHSDERIIECRHPFYPCPFNKADLLGPQIPCRVFYSSSTDSSLVIDYVPRLIEAIFRILGRHVVPKLDFVILPQLVSCLGFASPGLILISPSILSGRTPMMSRLGHEISHSWFGINIGPKNWNEEWISEGFATFMEVFTFVIPTKIDFQIDLFLQDVIELKMSKFSFRSELMALKSSNRYQILKSDCSNVDSSLLCMSATAQSSEMNVAINGLNRDKIVSQIPYLKGYFFLIQLAKIVGLDYLLVALKKYVETFHGCLVTTAECIEFFANQFQQKEEIFHQAQNWLNSSHSPALDNLLTLNRLDIEVTQHVDFWKRPTQSPPVFKYPHAMPDQVLSLLDRILELDIKMSPKTMDKFFGHYEPHVINADVYHRACELIVAQRSVKLLPLVRDFLYQHPAMGAYLYSELMLTDRPQFQAVATEVYQSIKNKLDHTFSAIIQDLIYPQE